jgi:nucleoside-diphosphate-sugar epimerase
MNIFLTGATGYLGGSVAVRLVKAGHAVTGLVRDGRKTDAVRALGVEPVVGVLDDADLLAEHARRSDGVVNAAVNHHLGAVDAFVDGLGDSGKPLLRTSGSAVVGDDSRGGASDAVFGEDLHAPGSTWLPEHPAVAAVVAVDRRVLAAPGVRGVVLGNSLVYGHGAGLARDSLQIPALVRQAVASGTVRHVGPGRNRWSSAHVDDVADLYLLALENPGARGFYFVENGEESFADLAAAIARALGLAGPEAWDIDSATAEWGPGFTNYALGSNSRVRSTRTRSELGWRPVHDSAARWIATDLR